MQSADTSTQITNHPHEMDLGPLSWVFDELRKSFETATKGLKRFLRESDVSQGAGSANADTTHLRTAKQQIHQNAGVLDVLGLREIARVVQAMESALHRFTSKPHLITESTLTQVEQTGFAVMEYLEYLLMGRAVNPLELFVQYRDMSLLAGVERVHPADLWDKTTFEWLDPRMPASPNKQTYAPQVRVAIDASLLKVMQAGDVYAAKELSELSWGLSETQIDFKATVFWKLCAAFFEAIAKQLLPLDVYVKRSALGVVIHYNNLQHRDWVFSDKFMHDMLFFCEQASPKNLADAPLLLSAKQTWSLKGQQGEATISYGISRYGHFNPTLIAHARKRIVVAKELWTSLASGDIQKIRSTAEQFKLVTESLLKVHPSSMPLAHALTRAIDAVSASKLPPQTELAMEVATALLYLESVFEQWGAVSDADMQTRALALSARMEQVLAGNEAKTVEPWIEDLYRRVSDKESMGSVVGELRLSLNEVEKTIDQFFREPSNQAVLQPLPSKLSQMRGIFSVLGIEQASSTVVHMRQGVELFMQPQFDFETAKATGVIDKFGNNLGALGFLIDMLNYQPGLVKKLFVFDESTGDLNPLMGRSQQSESMTATATVTDKPTVAPPAVMTPPVNASAITSVVHQTLNESSVPLAPLTSAVPSTPSAPLSPLENSLNQEELELRGVFIEEAKEVVANGLLTIDTLKLNNQHLEAQATLRRVFHTLKGSARMVGLEEFGSAGWAFEQLINTKLADQAPFELPLLELSKHAMNAFSSWIHDISHNKADHWRSAPFRRAADAMRINNTLDAGELLSFVSTTAETKEAEKTADIKPIATGANHTEVIQEEYRDLDFVEPFPSLPVHAVKQDLVASVDSLPSLDLDKVDAAVPIVSAVSILPSHESLEQQDDEQYKMIGSLKIGIPLYNVYLNEADEWARRLVTELDEWSLELHRPLPSATIVLAHSLAGSSFTVGYTGLAELARSLEHALDRVHQQAQGNIEHAVIFSAAAEECHRLLHQFAAGFLKEPQPKLFEQLSSVKLETNHFEVDAKAPAEPLLANQAVVSNPASSLVERSPATHAVNSAPIAAGIKEKSFSTSVISADEHGDDIDLIDVVDADLFHIFEEEARELFPQLGGALRQWIKRPDNVSARAEILRTLHTLKGSSRLAGAMRLGEMSHRMESEIEALGADNLTAKDLEPLLGRLDGLQYAFEGLSVPSETVVKQEVLAASTLDTIDDAPKISTPVTEQESLFVENAKPSNLLHQTAQNAEVKTQVSLKPGIAPAATNVLVATEHKESRQSVRVRAKLLDKLVNQAGEVMLTRTRIESELGSLRGSLGDLTSNLDRLRQQLRDVEFQAETQMQSRMEQAKDSQKGFDPLEFDRFTRVQELTRMMAESVNDVATVQRNLQRTVDLTEDDLVAQARQTRDLQRDLLRTRMDEFESISERLYRVVRQASKETGKPVKLDIHGGSIEMDRGVLERMTASFEHLLRNCVAHGIESTEQRSKSGKDLVGVIAIKLLQDGNDVLIEFSDDGVGLNTQRILEQAVAQKLVAKDSKLTSAEIKSLIFSPGLSTAHEVTELAGRGIGLDVVRSETMALGGRIEVASELNKGTSFKLILPLTTAVTQVVMMRSGNIAFGVPAHLVEIVHRAKVDDVERAYANAYWGSAEDKLDFYWSGALLQSSRSSNEVSQKYCPVVTLRSAGQRIALHVDEVLGNKEVVIKNLGPQLARLPGLAGMAILVSGAVALIYNPVALAAVYGKAAQHFSVESDLPMLGDKQGNTSAESGLDLPQSPLILVVDDSITVRRVTQRMLQREGFRVALAVDGLQAIEKLGEEIPAVVLSDIEMPRMDGFDLVRHIRAEPRLKHLPIVMITSRIAEKHRDLAKDLGVNNYLGKPYSEEGLLSILRQHTAPVKAEADVDVT